MTTLRFTAALVVKFAAAVCFHEHRRRRHVLVGENLADRDRLVARAGDGGALLRREQRGRGVALVEVVDDPEADRLLDRDRRAVAAGCVGRRRQVVAMMQDSGKLNMDSSLTGREDHERRQRVAALERRDGRARHGLPVHAVRRLERLLTLREPDVNRGRGSGPPLRIRRYRDRSTSAMSPTVPSVAQYSTRTTGRPLMFSVPSGA
jgi:hypothetical protein